MVNILSPTRFITLNLIFILIGGVKSKLHHFLLDEKTTIHSWIYLLKIGKYAP